MNATTYTKDYDGNRDPYAQARIEAVNFVAASGDKMRVPVELLRQLIAELDEEGGWLGRDVSGEEKGATQASAHAQAAPRAQCAQARAR
jgi:hypothetical protein